MFERETAKRVLRSVVNAERTSNNPNALSTNKPLTHQAWMIRIVEVLDDLMLGEFVFATGFQPLTLEVVNLVNNNCYIQACLDIPAEVGGICNGVFIGITDDLPVFYVSNICNPSSQNPDISSGGSSSSGGEHDSKLVDTFMVDLRCENGVNNVYVVDLYTDWSVSPIRFSHTAGCCACSEVSVSSSSFDLDGGGIILGTREDPATGGTADHLGKILAAIYPLEVQEPDPLVDEPDVTTIALKADYASGRQINYLDCVTLRFGTKVTGTVGGVPVIWTFTPVAFADEDSQDEGTLIVATGAINHKMKAFPTMKAEAIDNGCVIPRPCCTPTGGLFDCANMPDCLDVTIISVTSGLPDCVIGKPFHLTKASPIPGYPWTTSGPVSPDDCSCVFLLAAKCLVVDGVTYIEVLFSSTDGGPVGTATVSSMTPLTAEGTAYYAGGGEFTVNCDVSPATAVCDFVFTVDGVDCP